VPRVIKGVPQIPELRQVDAQKKKRHGDTFIAGALAWHASRTLFGTTDYDYEPAARSREPLGRPRATRRRRAMSDDLVNDDIQAGAWCPEIPPHADRAHR
jgi:phage FluMu gp28-like protein